MGLTVTLIFVIGYIILSLLLTPLQVKYIKELKRLDKKRQDKAQSQDEMYDNMSFEEQQLHFNSQGPLFFLANMFATMWIWYKQKSQKKSE